MTKDYHKKKADTLLKELPVYRAACENLAALEEAGCLSLRQAKAAREKRTYYAHILRATDRALTLLSPTERTVIDAFYFNAIEHTFFDLCEQCHMEKSTLYRHRAAALEKIGRAIWG